MTYSLEKYYCERIGEEVFIEMRRSGISVRCSYYHSGFNRYIMKPRHVCFTDFPSSKMCLAELAVQEEDKKEKSRIEQEKK